MRHKSQHKKQLKNTNLINMFYRNKNYTIFDNYLYFLTISNYLTDLFLLF